MGILKPGVGSSHVIFLIKSTCCICCEVVHICVSSVRNSTIALVEGDFFLDFEVMLIRNLWRYVLIIIYLDYC